MKNKKMATKIAALSLALTVAGTSTLGTATPAFAIADADKESFNSAVKEAETAAEAKVTNALFDGNDSYALLTDAQKAQAIADGKAFVNASIANSASVYWNNHSNADWDDEIKAEVEALSVSDEDIKEAMLKDVMPAAVNAAKAALKSKAEGYNSADYVDDSTVDAAKTAAKGVYEADTTLKALKDADEAFDAAVKDLKTKAAALKEAKDEAKKEVEVNAHAYKQTSPDSASDATYEANAKKATEYLNDQIDAAETVEAVEAIDVSDIADLVAKLNNKDTLKTYVTKKADEMKKEQQTDEAGAYTGKTMYKAETVDAAVKAINDKIEALTITGTEGIDSELANVPTRAAEDQKAAEDAEAEAAEKEAEAAKQALADAKKEAKAALDAIDKTVYDEGDQATFDGYVNDGKAAIDEAESVDAVNEAKQNVLDQVKALKTAAQKEAAKELATAKKAAKDELDKIDKTVYDEGDQTTFDGYVNDGKAAIDEAESVDAVNKAKQNVLDQVKALKTAAEKEAAKEEAATALKAEKEKTEEAIKEAVAGDYSDSKKDTYFAALDAYMAYLEKADQDSYEAISTDGDVARLKSYVEGFITKARAAVVEAVEAMPADEVITLTNTEAAKEKVKAAEKAVADYKDTYEKYADYGYQQVDATSGFDASNNRIADVEKEIVVIELINKIPAEVTIEAKDAVEAANNAYLALIQNNDIDEVTLAKLSAAVAALEEKSSDFALTVAEEIANLDETNKEAVVKARADYNALTEAGKEKVSEANVKKLEAAEKAIAKEEAKPVVEAIKNLENAENQADVDAAKVAYEALDENAKKAADEALADVEITDVAEAFTAAETAVAKKADEKAQEAADAVVTKINQMSYNSKDDVKAAKDAYDALDAAAQAKVPVEALVKLNTAVAKVAADLIQDDIFALSSKAVTVNTYKTIGKEAAAIEKRIAALDKEKLASVDAKYLNALKSVKAKVSAKSAAITKASACTSSAKLSTKGLKKAVKITASVSSANNANKSGFEIYKYDKKTKKYTLIKKVASTKKSVKFTKKKLAKGKKYYVAVRSYKVIDGKTFYGKMSKTVNKKIK